MAAISVSNAGVGSTGPSTVQVAAQLPGYDAAAVIAAQEQGLAEYLNRPVQEILAQLGLSPLPPSPAAVPAPDAAAAPAPPIDPGQLIKPVTDALGTLGNGMFENLDPTAMLDGISQALSGSSTQVSGAMTDLADVWEGSSGTAAVTKTKAALDDGAEVNTQAAELRSSLLSAAAAVKQAEARLIQIISQFVATIIAIGPSIIFPWGWAAAIAAATEATTLAAETMTELQAQLSGETARVSKAGQPVEITEVPFADALASQLAQAGSSSGGGGGSKLLSSLMDTATKAAQTGTDLASQLGGMGAAGAPAAAAAPVAASAAGAAKVASAGGAAAGGGGGAGGVGGAHTLAARTGPTMPGVSEEIGRTVAASARPGGTAGLGAPMMGGAPFAPMGAGARVGGGDHTVPSFLHTTDHGEEIVGDLGAASPPVIGEDQQISVKQRNT